MLLILFIYKVNTGNFMFAVEDRKKLREHIYGDGKHQELGEKTEVPTSSFITLQRGSGVV